MKHLKEFKLDDAANMNVGDVVKADTFAAGDKVDVTGISKGHGYQGVIKRHGAGRDPDLPRRRPRPPSCRLHGLLLRSLPYFQGPRSALVRWAWSRSPSRIWMLSRSTRN